MLNTQHTLQLLRSTFRPRFYQQEALDQTLYMLEHDLDAAPVIAIPTGAGKSGVIGMLCAYLLNSFPACRITVATHVKELILQDIKALKQVWLEAPYGIFSAGLGLKQAGMPITFATVQSAVKNPEAFGFQHVMIIDEAHLLSPDEETSYQRLIAALRKINPKLRIIGLTATPFRLKQGYITSDGIFNKFSYDISGPKAFVRLIEMGYLIPLLSRPTDFRYDVSKIRKIGGDFNQGQLQRAVNTEEQTEKALQEALQIMHSRDHILVFGSGIDHVTSITSMLQAMGESAVCVHSKMNGTTQRDDNIEMFRNFEARLIVNDGILTTGVDFPFLDGMILLNPTTSPAKHVQILGRGTRPDFAPGFDLEEVEGRLAAIEASHKHNCLVCDFAGNIERCGPINDPRIPKKKGKGSGEIPIKICPQCGCYNHAAVRFCDGEFLDGRQCDFEFTFETKIDPHASSKRVIAREEPELVWFKVDNVEYEPFTKPHTPAMMRVKYYCGIQRFTELVCIEHPGFASKRARDWWRLRRPLEVPPETTYGGIQILSHSKVPIPTNVLVQVNTKYPRLVSQSFDGSTPMFTPDPVHPGHPSYMPKTLVAEPM